MFNIQSIIEVHVLKYPQELLFTIAFFSQSIYKSAIWRFITLDIVSVVDKLK